MLLRLEAERHLHRPGGSFSSAASAGVGPPLPARRGADGVADAAAAPAAPTELSVLTGEPPSGGSIVYCSSVPLPSH